MPDSIALPRLPSLGAAGPATQPAFKMPKMAKGGIENRRKPRITIGELNQRGVAAIQEQYPDLPQRIKQFQAEPAQERTAFEKVLDWVDLPRNLVGNVIGKLAGVETGKLPKATFGLPRVMMSDVLEKLGVQNPVAKAVVGFVGDVAIDPLTYLSAGAMTGLKVAKWVPRFRKPLVDALKAVATGGRAAPAIEAALGGPKVLAAIARNYVAKGATKRLMARSGGILTRLLAANATRTGPIGDAARALLSNPAYALKGRPLLRIPLTEVMGPMLPVGQSARAFKAMAEPGVAQGLARAARLTTRTVRAGQVAETIARHAAMPPPNATMPGIATAADLITAVPEPVRGVVLPHMKKLLAIAKRAKTPLDQFWTNTDVQLRYKGILNSAARSAETVAQKTAWARKVATRGAEAPDVLRLREAAEIGDEPANRVLAWLARTFGVSPMKSKALAMRTRATIGALGASIRYAENYEPRVQAMTQRLAKEGFLGGDAVKIRAAFMHMLDIGKRGNIRKLATPHQAV